MKFGFDWPSDFIGEDHGHPISLPFEPLAQVS